MIDVREQYEWEIAHINGARLIPLEHVSTSLATIDTARDVVLICKSGARSAAAVSHLRGVGYRKVWNLKGGIDAWSEEVDGNVPRY